MPRSRTADAAAKAGSTPLDRMAAALMDATIAAYVATNRHHDAPEWRAMLETRNEIAYPAHLAIAAQLLARGCMPPAKGE